MNRVGAFSIVAWAFVSAAACGGGDDPIESQVLKSATVLDLKDVKTNPTAYQWSDFRPNLKKLILSGQAETQHVAILWYTVADGSVALHYHAKTESVYVIDGTSTDAKGVYPTGTVNFNPPGSGHEVKDATGFLILAYASPPDFAKTSLIGEYMPLRIDTAAPNLTGRYSFEPRKTGVRTFMAPLDDMGGLSAEFVETTSSENYGYKGNYLLVLEGSCSIEGRTFGKNMLVVSKTVEPQTYNVTAPKNGSSCLAMGVSF
jgi:ChrR Cupin-like domain